MEENNTTYISDTDEIDNIVLENINTVNTTPQMQVLPKVGKGIYDY